MQWYNEKSYIFFSEQFIAGKNSSQLTYKLSCAFSFLHIFPFGTAASYDLAISLFAISFKVTGVQSNFLL